MGCENKDLSSKLLLHLENLLDSSQKKEVADHLLECAVCREEMGQIEAALGRIKSAFAEIREKTCPAVSELIAYVETSEFREKVEPHLNLCNSCREMASLLGNLKDEKLKEDAKEAPPFPATLRKEIKETYKKDEGGLLGWISFILKPSNFLRYGSVLVLFLFLIGFSVLFTIQSERRAPSRDSISYEEPASRVDSRPGSSKGGEPVALLGRKTNESELETISKRLEERGIDNQIIDDNIFVARENRKKAEEYLESTGKPAEDFAFSPPGEHQPSGEMKVPPGESAETGAATPGDISEESFKTEASKDGIPYPGSTVDEKAADFLKLEEKADYPKASPFPPAAPAPPPASEGAVSPSPAEPPPGLVAQSTPILSNIAVKGAKDDEEYDGAKMKSPGMVRSTLGEADNGLDKSLAEKPEPTPMKKEKEEALGKGGADPGEPSKKQAEKSYPPENSPGPFASQQKQAYTQETQPAFKVSTKAKPTEGYSAENKSVTGGAPTVSFPPKTAEDSRDAGELKLMDDRAKSIVKGIAGENSGIEIRVNIDYDQETGGIKKMVVTVYYPGNIQSEEAVKIKETLARDMKLDKKRGDKVIIMAK